MKPILALSILLSAIAWFPAFSELTDADLDKIRLIVNEGVKNESAASEARMKEYIDLKLDNVNNQIKTNTREIGAIRSQINVFIGIPLLIITLLFAWRALRDRANDKQIQALIAENEDLKRQQTITS